MMTWNQLLKKLTGSSDRDEKKTHFSLTVLLLGALFASVAQCGSGKNGSNEVPQDSIQPLDELLDHFELAYSHRDLELMDTLLAPGFVISYRVPDFGYTGHMTRAEYLDDLAGSFTTCGQGISDTLSNRTIEREGDIARARVEYVYECPSQGIRQAGTDYITFLKHVDGWKIESISFVKLEG
jgi:hypothetical protein